MQHLTLLTCLAVLLLPSTHFAQTRTTRTPERFVIPPQHRVSLPGACGWDCAESVARAHGYASATGMAKNRLATGNGGYTTNLAKQELTKRGIPFTLTNPGTYDHQMLRNAAPSGAIISVRMPHNQYHSIVVTQYSNNQLGVWNSSNPSKDKTFPTKAVKVDWIGDVLWIKPKR